MKFLGEKVMPRFLCVAIVLTLIGVSVLFKAGYIMVAEKDYWTQVAERFKKMNGTIIPKRGKILADNGEVLAASIPEYKLVFDFKSLEPDSLRRVKDQRRRDSLLNTHLDSIAIGMKRIFPDVNIEAFKKNMREGSRKRKMNWPIYHKRVSYLQYVEVKKLPLFRMSAYRGGFHVNEFETRKNPYGRLAARTVGDLFLGKDEARSGIELSYDSILRGKSGICHRQKVFNKYLSITDKPAEDGLDVQTTINVNMQDICEQALGDALRNIQAQNTGHVNFGVCILMEVATGDVKAITSLTQLADGSFMEIQNKAVSNLMEPGSVFKPMSFLVAFNDGYLHMDDPVDTKNGNVQMYGRSMKDFNWKSGGFGLITARQCIQKSSNVGVSTFIDRFYGKDPQRFVDAIRAMGIADDLHLPIPGYARPRISGPKDKGKYWARTDLPWMSIGYVTQIPPISTLTFYNGVANGGKMMRPRFIKALWQNGQEVKTFPPVVQHERMARPEAVRNLQTCLREVVTLGVGKKAGSKYVQVAGKTGTAQVWTKKGRTQEYLVSFAGFFPYEQPKYSMIVCINKAGPGGGNTLCGPVFRRVAENIMALNHKTDYSLACDSSRLIPPLVEAGNLTAAREVLNALNWQPSNQGQLENQVTWGTATTMPQGIHFQPVEKKDGQMPDLKHYGIRDALFRLETLGLQVQIEGHGRVTHQSIAPGQPIKKGDKVVLALGDAELTIPELTSAPDTTQAMPKDTSRTQDTATVPPVAAPKPAMKSEPKAEKPKAGITAKQSVATTSTKVKPKDKEEKKKKPVSPDKPKSAAVKPKDKEEKKKKSVSSDKPKAAAVKPKDKKVKETPQKTKTKSSTLPKDKKKVATAASQTKEKVMPKKDTKKKKNN